MTCSPPPGCWPELGVPRGGHRSRLPPVCFQEMKLVFPNAQRMNRGKHDVGALVQACKANGVTDLVVVHEHRGNPGQISLLLPPPPNTPHPTSPLPPPPGCVRHRPPPAAPGSGTGLEAVASVDSRYLWPNMSPRGQFSSEGTPRSRSVPLGLHSLPSSRPTSNFALGPSYFLPPPCGAPAPNPFPVGPFPRLLQGPSQDPPL
uniref:Brix domain-containing protein n=1 Tax=Callorhinchus milii TaxID=7868 RepID=A0A4W3H578_CALMI